MCAEGEDEGNPGNAHTETKGYPQGHSFVSSILFYGMRVREGS